MRLILVKRMRWNFIDLTIVGLLSLSCTQANIVEGYIVELPALALGKHPFLCDIFCGTRHRSMSGVILVSASKDGHKSTSN